MRTQRTTISTNNLALAAALCAVGIPFDSNPFVCSKSLKGGNQYTFFFSPTSACGQYDTQALLAAWDDESWHLENPEHPFAYIKCAFQNREKLLDKVNQGAALVVVEKNGKLAILSANSSPAIQTAIFSKL